MPARRVRVASVSENRPPWRDEIKVLFASLRVLGGSLAEAPAVAYFVSSVERETAAFLGDLGVEVRVVAPEKVAKANVLRMYEEPEAYDWLVALDPDVAVAGDFAGYLEGAAVLGRVAPNVPFSIEGWEAIFRLFDLELPTTRYMTGMNRAETIPYFNGGVLLVPSAHVLALGSAWRSFADGLLRERERLPRNVPGGKPWNRNQISLCLALAGSGVPTRALPIAMNFIPTDLDPALDPHHVRPLLLHHQHLFNRDLTIMPFGYRAPDRTIRRVNRALDATFGRSPFRISYLLRSRLPPDTRRGPVLRNVARAARAIGGR